MVWMYVACLLWKWILSSGVTNAMFRLIPGLDTFLITDGQIDTKNGVTLVSRKNFNWVTIAGSELRQSQEGYDLWLMTRTFLQNLAQLILLQQSAKYLFSNYFAILYTETLKQKKKAYGPNNINISKRTGKQIFVYPSSPGRCQM